LTISRLDDFVSDNGGGTEWYAASIGGAPLSGSANLESGNYYVDQDGGGCARQQVTVTLYSRPALKENQEPFWPFCLPEADDFKTLQDGIERDILEGVSLKYYDGQFASATLLQPDYRLKDNEIIWVSQTDPKTGCESRRRSIRVNYTYTIPPVFNQAPELCLIPGQAPPTLLDVPVGTGNTFYKDLLPSTSPVDPSITLLVDGALWYVSYNEDPCESEKVPFVVKLNPKLQDITGEPLRYCEDNVTTSDIVLFDQFKTEVPALTGTWSTDAPVAAPTTYNGAINISTLTTPGSYTYTYTVPSLNDCPPQRNPVTITIVKIPNAGLPKPALFCSTGEDDRDKNLFSYLDPKNGEAPDAGGTWTGPSPIVGGIYDPATMLPGDYTYTVTAEPCGLSTAIVTVTEQEQIKVGNPDNVTYCENELGALPLVSLFAQLKGETDPTGVWTTDSGVVMGGVDNLRTVDVNAFTVQNSPYTFTYTVTPNGICQPVVRTVQISIEEFIKAGSDTATAICSNATPVDLVTRIPGATPGGTWTFNSNPHSGTFDPAIDVAGIYTYTATNQKCNNSEADLTVTIDPFVDPGISAAPRQICVTNVATTAPINLFNELGGTPVNTGTWSGPAGITIQPDSTVDISGYDTTGITQLTSLVFTYTVGTLPTSCPNTSTVTIIIEPLPNAGEECCCASFSMF
jgi:hypothetical protein